MILFTMIMIYLGGCKICFDSVCQVSLPQQEQVLYIFCLCSRNNNSCMEVASVGVTYSKLFVSYPTFPLTHVCMIPLPTSSIAFCPNRYIGGYPGYINIHICKSTGVTSDTTFCIIPMVIMILEK